MIDFNIPPFTGKEMEYMKRAVENRKICGDGNFTQKCSKWMEERYCTKKVLLTTSCTHALEMTAYLANIQPQDEVIMPAYTFVSTADAFVLRGARIVYVDIRPETMNINEDLIEEAITERTKAIVPVHYAGVACDMDKILKMAKKYHLIVIEDAAQGMEAFYKGRALGTIGDFGCYSFHETKNFTMGEGGAVTFQNEAYIERAEILREKGTNRCKFFRGQVDKYTWMDFGSSYLPSDMNAAYLWAQLENADKIQKKRHFLYHCYDQMLRPLSEEGLIEQPFVPAYAKHNAHMYFIKLKNLNERTDFINYMKGRGVQCVFHYIPLNLSPAGKKYGRFSGEDRYTTKESERLVRLPMYYNMEEERLYYVVECVKDYFRERRPGRK
jgi:dTDP-4-amino-4,6-dideoxygalactose transaminase